MVKDNSLFAPKSYSVRLPTDNRRVNGRIINPPRLAELGGMTTKNADHKEAELRIKKPGGTA